MRSADLRSQSSAAQFQGESSISITSRIQNSMYNWEGEKKVDAHVLSRQTRSRFSRGTKGERETAGLRALFIIPCVSAIIPYFPREKFPAVSRE